MNHPIPIELAERPPQEISTASSLLGALREIYLAAGLGAEEALRCARADYVCLFFPVLQCAA